MITVTTNTSIMIPAMPTAGMIKIMTKRNNDITTVKHDWNVKYGHENYAKGDDSVNLHYSIDDYDFNLDKIDATNQTTGDIIRWRQ